MTFAIESLSAVTLATHDMARAVRFYTALGFTLCHGGESAPLSSFKIGRAYLNVIAQPPEQHWQWWGRVIFHVTDVDAAYEKIVDLGLRPEAPPRDAPWGERYFHLTDPHGQELSFARPL